jgi:hypothetical protein
MSASEMTPKGQARRWGKRTWGMILLLALALLLANAAFYVFRPKSSEWDAAVEMTAPTPGRVYVSALTKLTPSTGAVFAIDSEGADWRKVIDSTVMYPRVSPDGKLLAYAQGDTISVRDMNLKKTWKIADFHGRPSWSPDGQWLVISEGKLHEGKEWKTQTWQIITPA